MAIESPRESAPDMAFPKQTLVSLLIFAAAWETLSHLAPYLGIPPFAVPSLIKIARSIATITLLDIVVTLARVIGALAASFVLGLVAAMAMYRSQTLDNYLRPMIRILMAVLICCAVLMGFDVLTSYLGNFVHLGIVYGLMAIGVPPIGGGAVALCVITGLSYFVLRDLVFRPEPTT